MKLKLTRERMILAGLLLAAGGGLLADQFVFADAGTSENEYAVSTPTAAPTKAPRLATIAPEQRLAERLQQLAGTPLKSPEAVRDVFNGSPVALATGQSRPSSLGKRVLNGVLFGAEGKGVAIIDGRMVPVGSRLDGMQLIRVTQMMAVFSDGTREVSLKISQKLGLPN